MCVGSLAWGYIIMADAKEYHVSRAVSPTVVRASSFDVCVGRLVRASQFEPWVGDAVLCAPFGIEETHSTSETDTTSMTN